MATKHSCLRKGEGPPACTRVLSTVPQDLSIWMAGDLGGAEVRRIYYAVTPINNSPPAAGGATGGRRKKKTMLCRPSWQCRDVVQQLLECLSSCRFRRAVRDLAPWYSPDENRVSYCMYVCTWYEGTLEWIVSVSTGACTTSMDSHPGTHLPCHHAQVVLCYVPGTQNMRNTCGCKRNGVSS